MYIFYFPFIIVAGFFPPSPCINAHPSKLGYLLENIMVIQPCMSEAACALYIWTHYRHTILRRRKLACCTTDTVLYRFTWWMGTFDPCSALDACVERAQGARSYLPKFSFLFHLKNYHFKDVNLKFQLKWSCRLDVRSNFVYCSCLFLNTV